MFIIKKIVVGFVYTAKRHGKEEQLFLDLAEKKNMEIEMINLFKKVHDEDFERKVNRCDIIYNNSGEYCVLEPLKTIEEMGKTVIDPSKLYYYTENKWMFNVKCKKNNIPTPKTILLPSNLNLAKAKLQRLNIWPVVLKKVYGCRGSFVEKADNADEALKIMKKFWLRDSERTPIIAQEFIKSHSYRVTMIAGEVVQTVIKKSRGWKATGVNIKKVEKFDVDKKLKKILNRVVKAMKINVCGIDFLKKDGQWMVLEVNAEPGLDFFEDEMPKLVNKVLNFLKSYYNKKIRKH